MSKNTKTDKMKSCEVYLNILSELLKSSRLELSQKKIFELTGKSRAQNYKILKNLLEGTGSTGPLLVEIRDQSRIGNISSDGEHISDDDVIYKLKCNSWEDANNISLEGKFFLECYKHIGYLLDSDYSRAQFEDDLDITSVQLNKLKRKFFYLSKVQAKPFGKHQKAILEKVVKCLLNEKNLFLYYPLNNPTKAKVARSIHPLTLCQYRDDLYLLGYEEQSDGSLMQKSFKISRIKDVVESEEKFRYPSHNKWNPEEEYKYSSGLIKAESREAHILVHGHFKDLLLEKHFCNAYLMSPSEEDIHEYKFTYTDLNEFVGQLFTYAECVQILGPKELKEAFVTKAQKALHLNLDEIKIKKSS